MKVRLISPFEDAEEIWLGLDEPGMRRKVFRFVSPAIGSEEGKLALRERALATIREVLEKETGTPGVEQVFFTDLVLQ